MIKKASHNQKLVGILQKFARYTNDQKWFVIYLLALAFFLILFPIVKISSIETSGSNSIRLLSAVYWKTAIIMFVALILMIGWNISFKAKNFMIKYFDFKSNDTMINFICLWIMITAFFSVTETIGVSRMATSRISLTFWGQLVQIILIIGILFYLYNIIKSAKATGKKTKIVNIYNEKDEEDHEHELSETEKSKLKGLFGENHK